MDIDLSINWSMYAASGSEGLPISHTASLLITVAPVLIIKWHYKWCFSLAEIFAIVQSIVFIKGCLRTGQSLLVQMLQQNSRHPSECTNNSTASPYSFFTRCDNASISLCAWSTFKYHGTVMWQSKCMVPPYLMMRRLCRSIQFCRLFALSIATIFFNIVVSASSIIPD